MFSLNAQIEHKQGMKVSWSGPIVAWRLERFLECLWQGVRWSSHQPAIMIFLRLRDDDNFLQCHQQTPVNNEASMIFIKNKQIKLITKEVFWSESCDLCPAISDYSLTDFNEPSVISQASAAIVLIKPRKPLGRDAMRWKAIQVKTSFLRFRLRVSSPWSLRRTDGSNTSPSSRWLSLRFERPGLWDGQVAAFLQFSINGFSWNSFFL